VLTVRWAERAAADARDAGAPAAVAAPRLLAVPAAAVGRQVDVARLAPRGAGDGDAAADAGTP